ncbi:FG-GAP-like repeat-containing protein [Streptomyces sp. NPDC050658]|uniref:FG-GAP-like repeat-containing protein n=1 Tax=unclassified Streptomyces TaxID=2593676 RepID=UPI00342C04DA
MAWALATALAVPVLTVPVLAASQASAAPEQTSQGQAPGADPETAASLKAARTGERVEVLSHRTQFDTVYANPDGTFTEEAAAAPVRVRQNNSLVGVDTTLRREGGVVRPQAVDVGLEFSAGGDAPLVKITRNDRSLTVDWPGKLPSPRLEGDTALYPDVAPGIDLRMQAGVDGYQQLLVVKTREAADNPLLKQVRYGLDADGVRVRTDQTGNLTAVNPAGQEVFTAPAPEMWDSAGVPDTELSATKAKDVAALSDKHRSSPARPGEDLFEPRYGAATTRMPLKATAGELVVTPDQKVLSDPDTIFPVYIDPTVSSPRLGWTAVDKQHPTTSYWNHSSKIARVGHEPETGGTWRSFVQFDPRKLHGKQIAKSTLRIKNTHSWSCTKKPVEAWLTGAISSATTWNKQPTWGTKYATVTAAKGWSSSCPAGNLEFDVKGATTQAASKNWDKLAFGLRASESDIYAWKKFDASTAVLSTEYNSVPNRPSSLDTVPSTRINNTCGDKGIYATVGNTDVQLTAKVSDPDGGSVTARFQLWPTGKHDTGPGTVVNRDVKVTSGGIARTTVSKNLLSQHVGASNGNYSWMVQARDGRTGSDWTPNGGAPGCRFAFDPNRPSNPPGIASAQFPDGQDGWPENTSPARTEGTFTLSAAGIKDVAKYEYWTDWDPQVRSTTPSSTGGSTTVNLTPPSTGPQRVFARSLDKANNKSDIRTYLFYANPTGKTDKPGDLNGDGNPDLLALQGTGQLRLYAGQGNGRIGTAGTASTQDFTGSLITRRGDWTQDGHEDLIATTGAKGSRQLHVHPNNSFGYACTSYGEEATGSACGDGRRDLNLHDPADDHVKNADQILAIGDVDGPTDLDGNGRTDTWDLPSFPDLLVKEGDHLWLYFGHSSGYLDEYAEPVLIGDGGWSDHDLAAPGDVTKNGHIDLLARRRGTGELFTYQGTGPNGEGLGAEADRKRTATGFTPAARPLITSAADADNDGVPDLWSTTDNADQGLNFYPRLTAGGLGDPAGVGIGAWSGTTALG